MPIDILFYNFTTYLQLEIVMRDVRIIFILFAILNILIPDSLFDWGTGR